MKTDNPESSRAILRIMLVSPIPPPSGGIASWTASILPALRGVDGLEITHIDTAVRWRSANDLGGMKRIFGGTFQAVRDILRIRLALRKSKPHILHLCTSGSLAILRDTVILRLARAHRIGTVIHFRMGRLPDVIKAGNWEWHITRRAMTLADVVLLLDPGSVSAVTKSLPSARVASIPNPLDLALVDRVRTWKPPLRTAPARRIVYVGQIIPTKGITELVKACVLMVNVSIELLLIGEVLGSYRLELQHIGSRQGESGWLKFLGPLERQEAMRFIHEGDVFAFPSHTEGFPNVVLEAMALGKPIVATDVGAIAAMLDAGSDQPCGVVVAPRDVQALHAALMVLCTHPENAALYAQRAMQKATNAYAMEKIIPQYVDLWRSVADNR